MLNVPYERMKSEFDKSMRSAEEQLADTQVEFCRLASQLCAASTLEEAEELIAKIKKTFPRLAYAPLLKKVLADAKALHAAPEAISIDTIKRDIALGKAFIVDARCDWGPTPISS